MFGPDYRFHRVTDITPDFLREKRLRCLALDVDNTLALSEHPVPWDGVAEWLGALREHGVEAMILSNNSAARVKPFAKRLGLPYVSGGRKPLRGGYERCRRLFGCEKAEMAVVGDQLLTDIWGGSRFGITTILVEPIELEDIWLFRCKRAVERVLLSRQNANTGGKVH